MQVRLWVVYLSLGHTVLVPAAPGLLYWAQQCTGAWLKSEVQGHKCCHGQGKQGWLPSTQSSGRWGLYTVLFCQLAAGPVL